MMSRILSTHQSPHLFVTEDLNVTLKCSQIGTSHNSMYWFRKTPTEPLEQIVHFFVKTENWEKDFKQRASAVRNGASLDLTLAKVQSSDSGVYYCAKQDAHQCNPIYNLNKNTNTCSSEVT
uniref:Ig-like domain-containing protein n=1 Tax=Sinocyclocheilus rhinocerous TaxID=307959 RepID=A0A673M4M1_9TELE